SSLRRNTSCREGSWARSCVYQTVADRTLRAGGPAWLCEHAKGYTIPVLCNLFGTPRRVALGMVHEDDTSILEVGKLLSFLKDPAPENGFR
ncbi:hypothetical protein C7R95_25285, partial [Enterobacter hormaechei]